MNKKDFIKSSRGQLDYPGKKTLIPNAKGRITMKGVNYPVLGIDDQGNQKLMLPNQEYLFPGNSVYEIPFAQNGGENDGMIGMMKARMAYADAFGNPSAKRMTSSNPPTYTFNGTESDVPAGETGTHYMSSMDNYAVPFIQQGDNKLFFNPNASPYDKEAIRFDNDKDAQYFAEHYKEIAPMSKNDIMKKQMGGGAQDDQQMLMDMIQQYAQAIGADPEQIMQELQNAGPEEQQSMMQQMTEAVQQGMPEQNPYAAEMQLGGAPEDHSFQPPLQEMYAPVEMQVGGPTNQLSGYMNKTNNFVEWLRKKSMDVNMQKMPQMMTKFQNGGNYIDNQGFYHNVNQEASYMGMNTQQPNPQYGNYNPIYNPLSGGYSNLFPNTQQNSISKLPRDLAIQSPNVSTTTKKKIISNNSLANQDQTINTDQNNLDPDLTQDPNTANWQGQWYDPNNNVDVTNPTTLSQNTGTNTYQGNGNRGYNQGYNQGSYGYGTPNFNFGYPGFGGGLLNFIPNMIMALGSLGQYGKGNLFNGKPGSGASDRGLNQNRDNRPLMNKKRTVGLNYSNDPNHQGDKGEGIKSLAQKKYPNPYMSYEDEIKLLAEQNAPTSADRTNKAFDFLKKFKNRPMQFGGDPNGEEIDLENPDYFNLQYNMYPQGQDFLTDQDVTYTDPNTNYNSAPGAKAAPKSKGAGFMMGNNPWAAEEAISDINAITSMKNQADMAKRDRLMKRDMNDVTKNHSINKKVDRGDWFSGPGLANGMFRPNQNIYSGPNAFAKSGGTFFNSNFFQDGGDNESQENNQFDDYTEGDEMFLTDDQIQKILDAGGDIEFL